MGRDMDWKLNPMLLAEKLVKYIIENESVSIDQLDVRVKKHNINIRVMDQALQHIHRMRTIDRKVLKNVVHYSLKVVKKKDPFTPYEYYPEMNSNNNADHPIFSDMDLSYLFLKPEEIEKYKAQLKGRTYIPSKRYQRKKKEKAPKTVEQQQLISMFTPNE